MHCDCYINRKTIPSLSRLIAVLVKPKPLFYHVTCTGMWNLW